jgi:hypothetical protein
MANKFRCKKARKERKKATTTTEGRRRGISISSSFPLAFFLGDGNKFVSFNYRLMRIYSQVKVKASCFTSRKLLSKTLPLPIAASQAQTA